MYIIKECDLKRIAWFIIVAGFFVLTGLTSWLDAINLYSSIVTIGEWFMMGTRFSANGVGKRCEEPCQSM